MEDGHHIREDQVPIREDTPRDDGLRCDLDLVPPEGDQTGKSYQQWKQDPPRVPVVHHTACREPKQETGRAGRE